MKQHARAHLERHLAVRPVWRCRECAAAWPCPAAKLRLRAEYAHDRPGLAIYLCVLMHDAISDRLRIDPDGVDPAEYFRRFIGWTRSSGLCLTDTAMPIRSSRADTRA
ncbi:hypothetical protein GA0070616_4060 [Micromonospora nigra]|uniref:Flavin reductase n=1 Tax=Micromonospora nigra TaxID=145857 RepID=A0A1C6SLG5_9ACTN|nr:hypothetical protein [Micromonospora nigra]SCL30360.1 hypothetical protein GA0070616_4060 [Micromonospora nigra]